MSGQLRTRQKKRCRYGKDRRTQYDAYTQQQGIPNCLHIFRVCDGLPRLIQIKAAINDDRLRKYCNQRAENQTSQKHQQEYRQKVLFQVD